VSPVFLLHWENNDAEKSVVFMRKINKKNPFAFKAKQAEKKKASGKRIGKSRPEKANNQLNRRVK
jgi:hypothetical protein